MKQEISTQGAQVEDSLSADGTLLGFEGMDGIIGNPHANVWAILQHSPAATIKRGAPQNALRMETCRNIPLQESGASASWHSTAVVWPTMLSSQRAPSYNAFSDVLCPATDLAFMHKIKLHAPTYPMGLSD